MVQAVRDGASQRAVARSFRVSLLTVQRWLSRAGSQPLDEVDWSNKPKGLRRPHNRTAASMEALILKVRVALAKTSDLGEFGAVAIRQALAEKGVAPPSIRTIGRILERRGALDGRRRTRRPSPRLGWYLPDLADLRAELDSFDIVSGLVIQGGTHIEVLNGISLHGGLTASAQAPVVTSAFSVSQLIKHWIEFGRPQYVQFDNDTIFQGPHQYQDVIGTVMRTCLLLGVVPVFAPPREPGFQASVESFNGRWQDKVWHRFRHGSLDEVRERSDRYVAATRRRGVLRIEAAPRRIPLPPGPALDLYQHPRGRVIFIRRTDPSGSVSLLGRTFQVQVLWPHRLVRAEVDLTAGSIAFFALRRSEPSVQPLLNEVQYILPRRRFKYTP
jgi:hypothetical protein